MMAKVVVIRNNAWWAQRSLREKRLLLAMAALLAFVLIWFVVIRPLMDARAAADARLTAAVTDLGRARAEAASLKQSTSAVNNNPVPLPVDGFLSQSAGEQGFTNLQVVADGASRATISSAQVRPAAFFGWIGQLEARGLIIESLSARANQDQTIAVDAVLRAGNG